MDRDSKLNKYLNVEYADFENEKEFKKQQNSLLPPYSSNPIIDKLYKFTSAKFIRNKKNRKSPFEFKPEDLFF